RRKGCSRRWKRIEGKESPSEISKSVRRKLGRPWRKTSLAGCCDQRGQEARRFPDRQVSTKGAEKAQVEAMTLGANGTYGPNSTWRYYRWPYHCVIRDRLFCVE